MSGSIKGKTKVRQRAHSPERMKNQRNLYAIEKGFGDSTDKDIIDVSIPIGTHSNSRLAKRHKAEDKAAAAAAAVQLNPIVDRGASREKLKPIMASDNASVSSAGSFHDQIPNARLGPEVAYANKTSVLGSSQFVGCQGDFCTIALDSLENKDIAAGSSINVTGSSSEFRKKLMAGDGDKVTDSHSYFDKNEVGAVETPMKISYSNIILARQEMPLVKMQLERHKKGDTRGAYVQEDSFEDMIVSNKLPAYYYQDVPCCMNCYKIYTIVEKARSKAINKISKKRKLLKGKANVSIAVAEDQYDTKIQLNSDVSLLADAHGRLNAKSAQEVMNNSLTKFQQDQLLGLSSNSRNLRSRGSVSTQPSVTLEDTKTMNSSFNSLPDTESKDYFSTSFIPQRTSPEMDPTMQAALEAIKGLTKMDVSEIRSMAKPPAAVEVVLEAVMILLTGRVLTFKETHKFLGNGEMFLNALKDFDLTTVSDEQLKLVEAYVDNPLFRPENVAPVSLCASKFCAWVNGVVQGMRHQRGRTHNRINTLKPAAPIHNVHPSAQPNYLKPLKEREKEAFVAQAKQDLTFVQKVESIKASRYKEVGGSGGGHLISRQTDGFGQNSNNQSQYSLKKGGSMNQSQNSLKSALRTGGQLDGGNSMSTLGNGSIASMGGDGVLSQHMGHMGAGDEGRKKLTKREKQAMKAQQSKSTERLAAQTVGAGNASENTMFRCPDGTTKMPYTVLGKFSLKVQRCSFVVVHDFFDHCDGTAILFKHIAHRHEGCQVLCFNYPGQAGTVWPRLSQAERDHGAKEVILNNDWLADRLHELLTHVEREGQMLMSCPFHLVGIGHGASIAAAFASKYGHDPLYVNSLRSLVSINGFLYPDPQLSSILHSAYQVFESTPHSRPDISVSFWSRFVFSDDYLARVNPNLALNIYSAVSNPITNEGRSKLAKGCLQNKDMRGALAPDFKPQRLEHQQGPQPVDFTPVQVPVILLQSTEDLLVNASNVDPFLVGRVSKHLWSHMLNVPSDALLNQANDINSIHWVGRLSSSSQDYHKYSTLGKLGLRLILDSLRNPRGAFAMWTRSGHAVAQEYKPAVLDLLDVLACPTDDYVGAAYFADNAQPMGEVMFAADPPLSSSQAKINELMAKKQQPPKGGVLFKLEAPPKSDPLPPKSPGGSIILPLPQTINTHTNANTNANATLKSPANRSHSQSRGAQSMMSSVTNDLEGDYQSLETPYGSFVAQERHNSSWHQAADKNGDGPSPMGEDYYHGVALENSVLTDVDAEDVDDIDQNDDDDPNNENSTLPSHVDNYSTTADVDQSDVMISSGSGMRTPSIVRFAVGAEDSITEENPSSAMNMNDGEEVALFAPIAARSTSTSNGRPPKSPKPQQQQQQHTNSSSSLSSEPSFGSSMGSQPLHPALPAVNAHMKIVQPMQPKNPKPPSPKNNTKRQSSTTDISSGVLTEDDQHGIDVIQTGGEHIYISGDSQQKKKEWVSVIPSAATALELEAELREKQKQYLELEQKLKEKRQAEERAKAERVLQGQAERRKEFKDEDQKLLESLEVELDARQKERDFAERQRRLDMQNIEKALVADGLVEEYVPPADENDEEVDEEYERMFGVKDETRKVSDKPQRVPELNPQRYDEPAELPKIFTEDFGIEAKLDRMKDDEEAARKAGRLSMEQYEEIKAQMAARQLERDQMLRHLSEAELQELEKTAAINIQRVGRGYNGREKAKAAAAVRAFKKLQVKMSIIIQKRARGMAGRKKFERIKDIYLNAIRNAYSATQIQKIVRGFIDRKYFRRLRRHTAAVNIQRCYRGHLGRLATENEKLRLRTLKKKTIAAIKIQSSWRMKVSREEFRSMRIHVLACIEIQRCFRGFLGRKKMNRRRQWETAAPGPERISLGLQFIEESKVAFERQQEEIDALHRAQERAEARVSHIHSELKESEKELVVLERELQEIDQIERDLNVLTHERHLLVGGVEDAVGMPRTSNTKAGKGVVMGRESNEHALDPLLDRKRKAEAYALEMTIQIKRAEREKKRQELEIEFAAVFQEVDKKKKALERLEHSLADMESTRERKDREFKRLQKNLMQLLSEQKKELDDLREKGIELETASATTAAAAVATAQKAKEHEKRSGAMFSQTEELMKFQFMSMSLSYFSSLNMLKSLRDMNADTTSAAVSMSADAAASAASAAAAANLPNMKKLSLGAGDFLDGSVQKKKMELAAADKAEQDLKNLAGNPIPSNVRTWTVSDVSRWLDSLFLSQYIAPFSEASVDGPFLMELREEDLVQVLGMKHKLHVRKILLSREKLKPLNQREQRDKEIVEREEAADMLRADVGVPSLDTVFSQVRNGRIKRVEESLNLGFNIETEDEKGNTALLIACQNSNRRLVEMLLIRGANINHQNGAGNTALHYAIAFDSEGGLGEYLIAHGADDTIENIDGLSAYDGVAK